MNKKLLTSAIAFGTLAISSLLQAAPAKALGLTCDMRYENNVDATGSPINLGCQRGMDNNDKINPLQVNVDELFGFSDWNFLGKDEEGGSINISNAFPTNTTTGEYNLNSFVQDYWTDVMLVLKGGNGKPIRPQEYVGYLVAQDDTGNWTGNWITPFINQNSNNPTGVSHISLYYREGITPVPTPALLPGLIGMGVASLRKRKRV